MGADYRTQRLLFDPKVDSIGMEKYFWTDDIPLILGDSDAGFSQIIYVNNFKADNLVFTPANPLGDEEELPVEYGISPTETWTYVVIEAPTKDTLFSKQYYEAIRKNICGIWPWDRIEPKDNLITKDAIFWLRRAVSWYLGTLNDPEWYYEILSPAYQRHAFDIDALDYTTFALKGFWGGIVNYVPMWFLDTQADTRSGDIGCSSHDESGTSPECAAALKEWNEQVAEGNLVGNCIALIRLTGDCIKTKQFGRLQSTTVHAGEAPPPPSPLVDNRTGTGALTWAWGPAIETMIPPGVKWFDGDEYVIHPDDYNRDEEYIWLDPEDPGDDPTYGLSLSVG